MIKRIPMSMKIATVCGNFGIMIKGNRNYRIKEKLIILFVKQNGLFLEIFVIALFGLL